jgi:CubicO group peptidase (beta-lactamase class C family)
MKQVHLPAREPVALRPAGSVSGLIALVVAVLVTGPAAGQAPAPEQVDATFAAYDQPGSPGCAVGIVQDGRIIYTRGYGLANLDYDIPNGPDMVYYVGSVSKQFTAAAIALLAEDGVISLDDDIRQYFPELPDYGQAITVRHLIHHTSGLRDIYTLMSLAGIRLEDVFTDDQALALIARQRELNFEPGSAYLYSNSGYWLLGQLVGRVTGLSLREFADRRIFQPLGMTSTHFHDAPRQVVRNRVVSYMPVREGGFRISYIQNFDKVGAGGLYTTLADLARWDANYYSGAIGGDGFLQLIHTRGVLSNGDTLTYAFGNNVQRRRGLDVVRHSGSLMGFRADLVRYPAERFSVITTCNLGTIDAGRLADQVAELYLGPRLAPVVEAPAATGARPVADSVSQPLPTPADLDAYTGVFHSTELNASWHVSLRGETLTLTRRLSGTQPLRAQAPDRFTVGSQRLHFERDDAGAVTGFRVEAGRVRNILFERRR